MLAPAWTLSAPQHLPIEVTKPMLELMLRDDCHLCDLALVELAAAGARDLQPCYIDGDAALEARYGARVPVLRDAAGRELDWPFTREVVLAWLAAA